MRLGRRGGITVGQRGAPRLEALCDKEPSMTGAERRWRHLRMPAAQRGAEGCFFTGQLNVGGTTKYV